MSIPQLGKNYLTNVGVQYVYLNIVGVKLRPQHQGGAQVRVRDAGLAANPNRFGYVGSRWNENEAGIEGDAFFPAANDGQGPPP